MQLPTLTLLTTLATLGTATTADTLRPRNWDLRLLKPGCETSGSNFAISVYHAQGVSERSCVDLTAVRGLNLSIVDTVSWKSPSEPQFDLCMYGSGDCDAGELVGEIRNGWGVCVKYEGWRGWRLSPRGKSVID
ncbi:hypothetical protein ABOM_003251 [Aspergillus bombycis]|uniref:Ecp2 effector protein domain-containing protein n=1 Tax=Aspergillus bombycis TaxID=109264 RepID=A0A1F8A854_9EURO|nr:hypothetical protein ABOM_003251 [Aspergillus bombycis]OGM47886.1 hypothetical protein ABOM_003251 [Aspergillus bombycis]